MYTTLAEQNSPIRLQMLNDKQKLTHWVIDKLMMVAEG
jgi:hypothetical protein